jgi:hypothetical protein
VTLFINIQYLIAGVIVGFALFPFLIDELKVKLSFGATKTNAFRKKTEKREQREIRNSKVFKDRLFNIIERIKEESIKGKHRIEITHLEACKTDQQIRKVLEERKYETSRWNGDNSLTISW